MSQIAQIFNSLEGRWHFHRTISNFGTVEGEATFKRSATEKNLLHYREDGEWISKNGLNKVHREYLYQYQNEKISAYFAEQKDRLLHTLEFQKNGLATAKHLCACDLYAATYQFHNPDEFELTYRVEGPKKNYTMTTLFQRLQNPE